MRILIALVCIFILATQPALAQKAQEPAALKYAEPDFLRRSNDYTVPKIYDAEEVPGIIEEAKESEDADVQYSLGYMFEHGDGVIEDWKHAAKWYELAAENGHVDGMLALARLYKNGGYNRGVPRNILTSIRWFSLAAKRGNPHAYYELALLYETGDGVFQNLKKAHDFFRRAADAGITNAFFKLGLFYQYGVGVDRDLKKAVQYYKQASKDKSPIVQEALTHLLGKLYADFADIEESEYDAIEWLKKAAEFNDETSQIKVADYYRDRRADYEEAKKWYEVAAAQFENLYAMENLGYIHMNALGVPQDYCKARDWYQKAAERGSPDAAWNLGNIYFNGNCNGEKDKLQADRWYRRAEVLRERIAKQRR